SVRFDWRIVLHARGPQRRLCRVGHWMVWRPGICGICRAREGDTRYQARSRSMIALLVSRLKAAITFRRHSAASHHAVRIPAAERIAPVVSRSSWFGSTSPITTTIPAAENPCAVLTHLAAADENSA